ncbi:MAG: hypothetical protein FWD64_10585, partial [Acidobacteriaceae bacterium]|nr:hypothetical protein [Acidobacteriaceae bacterium]
APAPVASTPELKQAKTPATIAVSGENSSSARQDASAKDDDVDRPTLKRRAPEKKVKEQASVSGGGLSLNDDPDRPTLHRQLAEEKETIAELRGMPADMRQMVAVSDAKNREPHIFARAWQDETEHATVLEKVRAIARAKLAAYKAPPTPPSTVIANSSAAGSSVQAPSTPAESVSSVAATAEQDPGAPVLKRGIPQKAKEPEQTASTAAPRQTAANRVSSKASRTGKGAKSTPAPIELLDEDLRGFTLSYGGAPTFVYMAHTDGVGSALRYVTVVVQDNGIRTGESSLGELKLALASVTDEAHLDRTPRLRFIDAVDAEASNRASLLFEMRAESSRQFALYRVIAAKPEQLFVTNSTE